MLLNKIYNQDNLESMATLPDHSIDYILTDPPYLYLKGQKPEREFDERKFFSECKRVLKKDGLIVLFGRGSSFYRWNSIPADLKFALREETIWDEGQPTSPLLQPGRVHETVSIHSGYFGEVDHLIPWQIDHLINWRPVVENASRSDSKLVNKSYNYS